MTAPLPEILSPVGNREMLVAAVRAGADAVYLGAKQFSARRNAVNFSTEELKEAVAYCHIRNVKVYLTLNILLKDEEMEDAFSLAREAFFAGIDGLIVADSGLARLLHKALPDLPLHASTQMTVLGSHALPLVKEMGFTRVVAPRELTKAELAAFCQEAARLTLEVEVFIHGALCMSVSGQCLLSAYLGGRSGNRGLCAGPCRLPFSATGGTGYDLSLKDLSLLPFLHELKEMGVASFKIEGRMKRPEYFAAATAAAKAALQDGTVPGELEHALKDVFSRSGFTAGYYEDKRGKAMFGIRTKEDVTASSDAFPLLHELIRRERRSVPLTASLTAKSGVPLTLTLSDGQNRVTCSGEIPQAAVQKAATAEGLRASFDKFGATPYFLADFKAETQDGLFIRQSDINTLRRQATEALDTLRANAPKRAAEVSYSPEVFTPYISQNPPELFLRVADASQLPDRLCGVDAVIFPLEKAWNASLPDIRKIVEIPRGFTKEDILQRRLQEFRRDGFTQALCGDLAAFAAAKKAGLSSLADSGMNILNSHSALAAARLGADGLFLSAEITAGQLQRFSSPIPYGMTVYGKTPLMLFRNCPIQNGTDCKTCNQSRFLTDRTGTRFAVKCRMSCKELYNSVPLWLADKAADLEKLSFVSLYCTDETKERVAELVTAVRQAQKPDVPYTRGLFYRGTK